MRGLRARTPGGRFPLAAAAALVLAAVSVAVLMPGLAGFASSGELTYRVFVPQTAKDAPGAPGVRVLPPAEGVYHSAFPDFGGEEDRVTAGAISSFTALAGKPIAWAYFSDNWFDGISFPAASARAAHDAGAIPFIRMMPRSTWDEEGPDPVYSLAAIAGGQFDDSLRQWARDAKASPIHFALAAGLPASVTPNSSTATGLTAERAASSGYPISMTSLKVCQSSPGAWAPYALRPSQSM